MTALVAIGGQPRFHWNREHLRSNWILENGHVARLLFS
jgi:hypothetical protein